MTWTGTRSHVTRSRRKGGGAGTWHQRSQGRWRWPPAGMHRGGSATRYRERGEKNKKRGVVIVNTFTPSCVIIL